VVSLRSVSRAFQVGPAPVAVIRDVSLDVERGDSVAIMGPSGSGKSTLMNLIGLLDRPTSGSVIIDSTDVARLSDDERSKLRGRRIGFVFQSYNLLARYTALENVQLPLVYAGVARRRRLHLAGQALEVVGMAHRVRHLPSQMSGGEQQRVAIARALVCAPPIVLADEPTGALDSRTGSEIMELFSFLHRSGRTVIIITHDAGVAAKCRRTVRLRDGRIMPDLDEIEADMAAIAGAVA
jgi:putative ABC transport system ATP-binding protein